MKTMKEHNLHRDWLIAWMYVFNTIMFTLNAALYHYKGAPNWLVILFSIVAFLEFLAMFSSNSLRFWLGVLFRSLKGQP